MSRAAVAAPALRCARRRAELWHSRPPHLHPAEAPNYQLLDAPYTLLLIHYSYSSQVLEVHCARTNGATDLVEAAEAAWPNLDEAHACVARLLGASMLSPEAFAEFLPLWKVRLGSGSGSG